MAREQFQTLTEPMYYILLSLLAECCGVDIMDRVRDISGGRVGVGPGTLYTVLQKFSGNNVIRETRSEGRQKWYIITDKGRDMLNEEQERLRRQYEDGRGLLG